jgi:hypothetical protein
MIHKKTAWVIPSHPLPENIQFFQVFLFLGNDLERIKTDKDAKDKIIKLYSGIEFAITNF